MSRPKTHSFYSTPPYSTFSSSEIDFLFSLEDPSLIPSKHRLYALLTHQNNSPSMTTHFKNSRLPDIKSDRTDQFLIQTLFDSKKSNPRQRRLQPSFNQVPYLKSFALIDPKQSPHLSPVNPPLQQPLESDPKKEQLRKVMSNLQANLAKSYQTYRQNFYSTTENKRVSHSSQVDLQSPVFVNKPFSVQQLPTEIHVSSNKKELNSCSFVDFNKTEVNSRHESPGEVRFNARNYSHYQISVDVDEQKDPKPSISTQCSNHSGLH